MSDDDELRLLTDLERAAIQDQQTADDDPVKQATREHLRATFSERREWLREQLQDPVDYLAFLVGADRLDLEELDDHVDPSEIDGPADLVAVAHRNDLIDESATGEEDD